MKFKLLHGIVDGVACTIIIPNPGFIVGQSDDDEHFGWNVYGSGNASKYRNLFSTITDLQYQQLRGWHFSSYQDFTKATIPQQRNFFRKYPFLRPLCQNDIRKSCI